MAKLDRKCTINPIEISVEILSCDAGLIAEALPDLLRRTPVHFADLGDAG